MAKSLEALIDEGLDIVQHLSDETLLVHSSSFHKNSCEARVIICIDLPDGRRFEFNDVRRFNLKEIKES